MDTLKALFAKLSEFLKNPEGTRRDAVFKGMGPFLDVLDFLFENV